MANFRWWLASVLACWAHSLMQPEMTGDDGVWFEHLAIAFVRRHARRGGAIGPATSPERGAAPSAAQSARR
jgi:hypothetical protein